jgi:hypothetical protein
MTENLKGRISKRCVLCSDLLQKSRYPDTATSDTASLLPGRSAGWEWAKLTSPNIYLSIFPAAPTWSIGHPLNTLFQFSFLILRRQSVWLSQGLYLHRTTQTQNKRKETSMPWVGFEPTVPAFERAKTVRALDPLDRAACHCDRWPYCTN